MIRHAAIGEDEIYTEDVVKMLSGQAVKIRRKRLLERGNMNNF